MTNKEIQKRVDKQKWLASQEKQCDQSGKMKYCDFCAFRTNYHTCKSSQEAKEKHCFCASAYNKMIRNRTSKRKALRN